MSANSFIVYPGADGKALKSLRLLVFNEGLQDLRALTLAEKLAGRDININSPKQIGELLFEHLKIVEKTKKTKSLLRLIFMTLQTVTRIGHQSKTNFKAQRKL